MDTGYSCAGVETQVDKKRRHLKKTRWQQKGTTNIHTVKNIKLLRWNEIKMF